MASVVVVTPTGTAYHRIGVFRRNKDRELEAKNTVCGIQHGKNGKQTHTLMLAEYTDVEESYFPCTKCWPEEEVNNWWRTHHG